MKLKRLTLKGDTFDAPVDGRFLAEPETLAQLRTAEELRRIRTADEPDEGADAVFQPGVIVRLKSGGPKMVVTGVPQDHLRECTWFDEDDEKQSDTFSLAALVMDMNDQEPMVVTDEAPAPSPSDSQMSAHETLAALRRKYEKQETPYKPLAKRLVEAGLEDVVPVVTTTSTDTSFRTRWRSTPTGYQRNDSDFDG